jgi:glutamine synthetase
VQGHIWNYGEGIEERLTGAHETAPYDQFSYGISNRGASIRIPGGVARDKRGYIEDRRPNANIDPYIVTRLIMETVCSSTGKAKPATKKAPVKKTTSKGTKKTTKKAPAKKAARR